jgi:hypothetical protein
MSLITKTKLGLSLPLGTRELRKKNMELEYYNCVLCDSSSDETLVHLLFLLKNQLQVPFFVEIIIILMCWTIWNSRNGLIFNRA